MFAELALIALAAQTDPARTPKAWLEACERSEDWERPGPPFRIHGQTYYVGTCGIAAILVAGDEGHILIDGGPESAAPLITANIEALGYSIEDVDILLHTQEHFDHVAALAELQSLSGARLLASRRAAEVMASGMIAKEDPQYRPRKPFPAARVDGLVLGGQDVVLGSLRLTPVETPGHSYGALSWHWRSCELECLTVVFNDGMAPMSADNYRFSDHPAYLAEFRASLDWLARADCGIFLTAHPAAGAVSDRIASDKGLVDPAECAIYAKDLREMLERRVATDLNGASYVR